MKKDQNFQRYLEKHFGLILPNNTIIFFADGVRIGNQEILKSGIIGEFGYAASDSGFNPTNSIIQNFGHLAKKNIVRLNNSESLKFAAGKDIPIDLGVKSKYVIVTYKGHTLGLGYYSEKSIKNKIPEKRRREIMNLDGL